MRINLGLHLVREGFITPEALMSALDYQERRRPRIGQVALRLRKMNVDQVLTVLNRQTATREAFGKIAIELGFVADEDVTECLTEQSRLTPTLGDILVEQKAIDADVLSAQIQTLTDAGANPVVL